MRTTETSRFARHNRKNASSGLDCLLFKSINNVIIMRACSSHPFDKTGCKVTESFLFITFRQKSIVCTLREIHLAKLVSMLRRTFPFAFVKTSLVDLHPEVCPSATEVGYQWIALVSNKLDKVVAYFLQRLDVSAIPEYFENTLRHFFWECTYFFSDFCIFLLECELLEN